MEGFENTRAVVKCRIEHLPFVSSLEDYDLLVEIGYWQQRGRPPG